MGVTIGNGNKIKNSTIAENVKVRNAKGKKGFYEKHPVISAFIISLIAGFVMLFTFWSDIISWIERWF